MQPKCPKCGNNNAIRSDRFEETKLSKSQIAWWNCCNCGFKYDEREVMNWRKDDYGRLTLTFKASDW